MSKTQLQQCREAYTAIEEEVTQLRIDTARWYEHRRAAETALYDMPTVLENFHSWRARAEAAEARVAELEFAQRGLLEQVEYHRLHALDAEIEVQRLRAEQQWRPGTVKPEQEGWYQVFDGEEWWYDHRFYSVSGWGVMGDMRPPTYWRPIPPMPEEAQ